MMQTWPLLDIREALADADRNLADVIYYTQTLQADTEGHVPPEASTLLANIAAMRAMLTEVLPPALVKAIALEQAAYEAEESCWDVSSVCPEPDAAYDRDADHTAGLEHSGEIER